MTALGIYDAKAVSKGGKVHRELLYAGLPQILKIDVSKPADSACALIHQPTGFAEILIFCILACFGKGDGIDAHLVVKAVEKHAYHHFKGGGRR